MWLGASMFIDTVRRRRRDFLIWVFLMTFIAKYAFDINYHAAPNYSKSETPNHFSNGHNLRDIMSSKIFNSYHKEREKMNDLINNAIVCNSKTKWQSSYTCHLMSIATTKWRRSSSNESRVKSLRVLWNFIYSTQIIVMYLTFSTPQNWGNKYQIMKCRVSSLQLCEWLDV